MTVAVLIFIFFLFFLFFWGRNNGSNKFVAFLLLGWMVKCSAAFGFFYMYSEVYGNGKLSEDAGAYVQEAKILNTIYADNPNDYFNVILNKHDFEQTITHYFKNVKISRIGPPSFLVNDTRNQIKFISLMSLVIGEDMVTVFTFFALISFIGLLVLWRSLRERTTMNPIWIFTLLLLPISLIFWTSGPLKETTSLFGLHILSAAILTKRKTTKWIVVGTVGLLFLWLFKPYLVVIATVSYILVYLAVKIIVKRKWSYGLTLVLFGTTLFYFSIPKKILYTVSDKQFDFVNVARGGVHMEGDTCFYFLEKTNRSKINIEDSIVNILEPVEMIAIEKGKIRREQKFKIYPNSEKLRFEYEQFGGSSFFKTKAIDRSWSNLILAVPEAIINTMLRPFIWTDFFSVQNTVLFIENLFFMILLIQIARKIKSISDRRIKQFIATLMVTSLLFSIIIGLTTPVSGAIIRYRIPIHLFILVSFILIQFKNESKVE